MDHPDIVMVMTDQHRSDQLGFASGGHFETPTLDALADRGVVFETAYSASPVCVPARNALLTGVQPHRLPNQHVPLALQEGTWTVAHALRRAGYDTALIGKMHFTPVHADHGFDVMRTVEHLSASRLWSRPGGEPDTDDYHEWLVQAGLAEWERLEIGRPPVVRERPPSPEEGDAPFPYDIRFHPTTWVEDEVNTFLDARTSTRPLFLLISFPHPHAPLNPLGPYATRYRPADAVLPAGGFELNDGLPEAFREPLNEGVMQFKGWRVRDHGEAALRGRLAKSRGLIRHIDDATGRILDRLDLDRTTVMFTADHGDYAGHRGLAAKTPWVPFDDLVRVPLVFAGAGVTGRGTVGSLVQSIDIALTICDLAGIDVPVEEFDSRSLRPFLEDPAGEVDPDRAAVFATNMGWPGVRRGRWKLIVRPPTWAGVLFDLEEDPGESVNVIDDPANADVLDDLRGVIHATFARTAPDLERFPTAVPLAGA